MKELKVYIVGEQYSYADFLLSKFSLTGNMEEANIVIFTGGEDVHPEYYGEEKGSKTSSNRKRDNFEANEFENAKQLNKFIVGICRGSQLLTILSGGGLIQHVTNHANGKHKINIIDENRDIEITSTHHQMLYPFNMPQDDYRIIAKSSKNLSTTYLNGYDDEKSLPSNFVEPEIVWYPKTNCLCIQGHPEYMDKKSEAVRFINVLVGELLDGYEDKIPEKKVQQVNAVNNNILAEAIQNARQIMNNRRVEPQQVNWIQNEEDVQWARLINLNNFGVANARVNIGGNELENLV